MQVKVHSITRRACHNHAILFLEEHPLLKMRERGVSNFIHSRVSPRVGGKFEMVSWIVYLQINLHAPRQVSHPAKSFESQPCGRTLQAYNAPPLV